MELVEGVHKLAVLRANAIGDYLVSLPAIQALRTAYPAAELVLLGADWHAGRARSTAACPCRQPSGWATTGRQLRPPRSTASSPACGPSGSTWPCSCRGWPPFQPVPAPAWGPGDRRVADARRPTP